MSYGQCWGFNMLEFRQPASIEGCLVWIFGLAMIWPIYNGLTRDHTVILLICGSVVLLMGFSWLISIRKITFYNQTLRIYFRSGYRKTLNPGEILALSVIARPDYAGMDLVIKVPNKKTRPYPLLGPEATVFGTELAKYFSPVSKTDLDSLTNVVE